MNWLQTLHGPIDHPLIYPPVEEPKIKKVNGFTSKQMESLNANRAIGLAAMRAIGARNDNKCLSVCKDWISTNSVSIKSGLTLTVAAKVLLRLNRAGKLERKRQKVEWSQNPVSFWRVV